MKQPILTPAQVRAYIQSRSDGQPNLIERVAKELDMTTRQLFNYQAKGVSVNIPDPAARLLAAAGVEVVGKPKRGK